MKDLGKVRVTDVFGGVVRNVRVQRSHDAGSQGTAVTVDAPGFRARRVFLDFNPNTVDEVVLVMRASQATPATLSSCCLKNLETAGMTVYLRDTPLWEYFGRMYNADQDRVWMAVTTDRLVDALEESPQWDEAPGMMHTAPQGWQRFNSWKLKREPPILQVTLHRRRRELDPMQYEYLAEVDMDLASGIGHLAEVLRNHATNQKTNPHDVAQALYVGWGLESYIPTPGGRT
jgi:hypothetical protein